jgi:hypothetical protein
MPETTARKDVFQSTSNFSPTSFLFVRFLLRRVRTLPFYWRAILKALDPFAGSTCQRILSSLGRVARHESLFVLRKGLFMQRLYLAAGVLALFFVGFALANDDQTKTKKNEVKATIEKVDPQNGTITVKMKNKAGKEVEKTYTLTADIEYLDSTGKVAKIDVFRAGDEVLIVTAKGKLKSMQMNKDKDKN